jgi:hypothetical protein
VNIVEILCTYVWKWKNKTWNYSKTEGREDKEWWKGVNLKKIHCKHFWKMSQYTPSTIIIC